MYKGFALFEMLLSLLLATLITGLLWHQLLLTKQRFDQHVQYLMAMSAREDLAWYLYDFFSRAGYLYYFSPVVSAACGGPSVQILAQGQRVKMHRMSRLVLPIQQLAPNRVNVFESSPVFKANDIVVFNTPANCYLRKLSAVSHRTSEHQQQLTLQTSLPASLPPDTVVSHWESAEIRYDPQQSVLLSDALGGKSDVLISSVQDFRVRQAKGVYEVYLRFANPGGMLDSAWRWDFLAVGI